MNRRAFLSTCGIAPVAAYMAIRHTPTLPIAHDVELVMSRESFRVMYAKMLNSVSWPLYLYVPEVPKNSRYAVGTVTRKGVERKELIPVMMA